MSRSFDLVTTDYRGGGEGIPFDDLPAVSGDLAGPFITKIEVFHQGMIFGLGITMSNSSHTLHGRENGHASSNTFESGEFVTRIEGRSNTACILELKFITNKGHYGPYGGISGEIFAWGASDAAAQQGAPRMRLLGFSGNADTWLNGLRAVFTVDRTVTRDARYESITERNTSGDIDSSLPAEVSQSFSNFTLHLMSGITTLYVGPNRVKFHAYEDTLCQLPFFQAALRGHFKEATERVVTMPEDDPSHVSALIEFLYTGSYTCTYNPAVTPLQGGSPVSDLIQGLFHLGISVIASKYDCAALAAVASKNFQAIVRELDSIGSLRLWQAAYGEGLRLPERGVGFEGYCGGKGLVAWVKCLYGEYGEEMENTMMEYPALAYDLLKIAIVENS